ncbi:glutathione S-transferase family protein [Vineibacter terrae]|uniref:glutathione S-transferase family protein n=1 Tax=Vineibacter terrae TaxID=2586908 RepID=UPI001C498DA9|nr:glutathione S-transferase family protein [Vineibacter terrae]
MKLYLLKNGVNPRRVRIFLAEKKVRLGADLPVEEFDMESAGHKTPDFLARNPLGTLPALELDDGTVIAESVAICRYFEEMIPEPVLMGRGALGAATAEMWNRRMELELLLPTIDVFVHTHPFWVGRRPQIADYGAARREHLVARMRWLDGALKDRPFIAGDTYGIADITAQVALVTARGALKLAIPDDHAHLARWFAAVSARPSARA